MAEATAQTKKLEWKWVGISFGLYVVFYLLPILFGFGLITDQFAGRLMDIFLGIWSFAGIIIIAGICGYVSKGITIWEPVIASLTLATLVLIFIAYRILFTNLVERVTVFHVVVPALFMMAVVFVLSILGAWLGELAEKLWKDKTPTSAANNP